MNNAARSTFLKEVLHRGFWRYKKEHYKYKDIYEKQKIKSIEMQELKQIQDTYRNSNLF